MRIATLLLVVAFCAPALAGTKAGVTMPDAVQVGDKQLVLNGMGVREATWLKIDVYVAGLYLEHPSSDAAKIVASDETKQLVLHFVHDADRGRIVEAWNQGFERSATVPVAQIRGQIDRLNAAMPALRKGDTLMFTYVPGQGVAVQVNGTTKTVIAGDDFARSLFSIWLGPKPLKPELRRGLLGSHA
jgi:hypothetical protein